MEALGYCRHAPSTTLYGEIGTLHFTNLKSRRPCWRVATLRSMAHRRPMQKFSCFRHY